MVKSSSNSINLSRFFFTYTHTHSRITTHRKARQTKRIDMCNVSSSSLSLQRPSCLRTRSMIKKTTTETETTTTTTTTSKTKSKSKSKSNSKSLKPARKSRTKTRKPKFLSLRLELSQQQQMSTTPTNSSSNNNNDMSSSSRNHQLNLFPLHPENMVDDKLAADINDDNNVAFLFHSEGGGGATLNGLLTSTTTTTTATTTMSTEDDSISMSYTAAYRGGRECCSEESQSLVRTAMRNRERDLSEEEKWVCYSEVVEKKEVEEETSSSYCAGGDLLLFQKRNTTRGSLSLKLDYEGILNAWSDKGPLYIHGESPQTVPDLQDDKVLMDGLGSAENVWKVPETEDKASSLKMKEEMGGREGWKLGQREASVLRYKEKRQSRLFAKRIRYEVRKLNAEKRPRMKGRFVKRS